jgi:FkbM family methyltransferase
MSTTLKMGYLRAMQKIGKRHLVANSVLGYPYRISLGDMFSENPFYNDQSNIGEVLACAAWIGDKAQSIVFDIGAHCGFVSTQLAQVLGGLNTQIYSFEPVPPTFCDLVASINSLGLGKNVHPIPLALGETEGFLTLNYSKWSSMLAQVIPPGTSSNDRSGAEHYMATSKTIDEICESFGIPAVIKIDIEGWEVPALRGARYVMEDGRLTNTGICLEWNPEALGQTGFSKKDFYELLPERRFYYINDYSGQLVPLFEEIKALTDIDHVCNVFAIHRLSPGHEKWRNNFSRLIERYKVKVG